MSKFFLRFDYFLYDKFLAYLLLLVRSEQEEKREAEQSRESGNVVTSSLRQRGSNCDAFHGSSHDQTNLDLQCLAFF